MRKENIRTHLRPYSILQKRRTTVNHAFASALAPCSEYDDEVLTSALVFLGQDPTGDLNCVYCDKPATTWDHLVGLVEKAELRGFGHQIGNLVPSCQPCNSRKGSRDWRTFIQSMDNDPHICQQRIALLQQYLLRFAQPIDLGRVHAAAPELWEEYCAIKLNIFELMRRADEIAGQLRQYAI
jgi:hypothetical protein